jgi:hypothetical protein
MILQTLVMPILALISSTVSVTHSASHGLYSDNMDTRMSQNAIVSTIDSFPDMDSCVNLMLTQSNTAPSSKNVILEKFDQRAAEIMDRILRTKAASKYEGIRSTVTECVTLLTSILMLIAVPVIAFSLFHIFQNFPYYQPGCTID